MIPKNVQMPNPNPKYKPPGTPAGGRGGKPWIDACQNCQWGPNGSKQCENVTLPLLMRGEGCAYWDLYRRFGEPKKEERK